MTLNRLVRLVGVFGVVLVLPSLCGGFYHDDYFHLTALAGGIPDAGPLSLYAFATRGDRMGAIQGDFLPWWADRTLSVDFWRPVSSLSLAVDHVVYGIWAPGYHLTNIVLWTGLMCLVLAAYVRAARARQEDIAVAVVAGVLFASSKTHAVAVAWISNRHAILGALLSIAAFWCYAKYRSRGARSGLVTALGLEALALLSSETALGFAALVLAYETCFRVRREGRRTAGAAIAAIVIGYVVYYELSGHGVRGANYYIDPLVHPLAFLRAMATERVPFEVLGLLTPVPAEIALELSATARAFGALAGWGVLVLIAFLLRGRLRSDPLTRTVALAVVLDLAILATASPTDRLLVLPAIGASWLIAVVAVDAWRARPRHRRLLVRGMLACAVAAYGAVPAILTARWVYLLGVDSRLNWSLVSSSATASELPPLERARSARVLFLDAPVEAATSLPLYRAAAGLPALGGAWQISMVPGEHLLERVSEDGFALRIPAPGVPATAKEASWRADPSLAEGERFDKGALEVVVLDVQAGRARRIRVTLDRALDDPDVWLMAWAKTRYVRIVAPAIGGSVRLPSG